MEETPPRRSRPKPPSGGSSLPFIPIIIGVIVLGFVIGAGLSVVGRHGSGDVAMQPTSSPSPSPVPSPMATFRYRTPAALPAVAHKPKPSPKPSATETSSPSPAATASVAAEASPAETQTQTPAAQNPTSTAVVKATSAPVAVALATHRPSPPPPAIVATRVATAAPANVVTAAPASVAPATAAAGTNATTVFDADGGFSRLAGNVVRQYLLSIARGDTDSAYAALGQGPGAHAGSLPEAGAVDSTMHISKIEARGSESSATVNVDLTTSAGPYYGQYTVHKSSTGAAIIVSHTFAKP
jgi:cytoskeletal protein RodZ